MPATYSITGTGSNQTLTPTAGSGLPVIRVGAGLSSLNLQSFVDALNRKISTSPTYASVGNKQAQLDLGIRFFGGDGVDVDTRRACRLFRMSASDTAGQLWIYTPSPGGGAPAQVMPIASTMPAYGLQAARDWSDRCDS